jgi:5-methylcytosine-specific restriction endonuclease McrA
MTIRKLRLSPTSVPNLQKRKRPELYGARWREASAAWLQQYPLCVLCLVRGELNRRAVAAGPADRRPLVVDHIEPHRGDITRFWDQDNWQTLCAACHNSEKHSHEQLGGTGAAWVAKLRDEMAASNSVQMVSELASWLPAGLRAALLGNV